MPTKIETHLSPEQFQEFCKRVGQTKGGTTLKVIQAIAEEFGVEISLMAASSFRDGPFEVYLERMRSATQMAETVSAVAKEGLSLNDAGAAVLSQKLFDDLLKAEDLSISDKNKYSLALSRLRSGDQRAKLMAAKLREYEAKEAERAEKKAALQKQLSAAKSRKGGVTKESLEEIEQQLKLL